MHVRKRKKRRHEASDEHVMKGSKKKMRKLAGENMLFRRANAAIAAPLTLLNCALRLTVGGGLVSPADPRIAAPVIVRPRGAVSLQQREELTAVLVQVVADGF